MLTRSLVTASLVGVVALASADVFYTVTLAQGSPTAQVDVSLSKVGARFTFAMPNWPPGAYRLSYPFKQVKDMVVTDGKGNALLPVGEKDGEWVVNGVQGGKLHIRYAVPVQTHDGALHFSGPNTYVYFPDRMNEKCKLTVVAPSDWKVLCGLDATGSSDRVYSAPDYDTLADNPVSAGNIIVDRYEVDKKPHTIALMGEFRDDIDRAELLRLCRYVTESQRDFFSGLPYRKYVWHFFVSDGLYGGGGLEHLSSTQIGMASGLKGGIPSLLAHEFFHLWNVKRIRSKVLGPFDYSQLPKTGALWWLEGVTDYYADLLMYRYGWSSRDTLMGAFVNSNYLPVLNSPNKDKVSAYSSSVRVGETDGGLGNSSGYLMSYYELGWLQGLCLDIELRVQTQGKATLDHVTRALWDLCRTSGQGFEEGEIRRQLVKFGGPGLGEFYDRTVMSAGMPPAKEQLAKIGLLIEERSVPTVEIGFGWTASKAQGGATVRNLKAPADGLQARDLIVEIGGTSLALPRNRAIAEAMEAAIASAQVGVPLKLKVKRGEQLLDVAVTPVAGTKTETVVVDDPNATAAQAALRAAWLQQKPIVSR